MSSAGLFAWQVMSQLVDEPASAAIVIKREFSPDEIFVSYVRGTSLGRLVARRGGGWQFDDEDTIKTCIMLHAVGDVPMTLGELRKVLDKNRDHRVAVSENPDTADAGLPLHIAIGGLVQSGKSLVFDDMAGKERTCILLY